MGEKSNAELKGRLKQIVEDAEELDLPDIRYFETLDEALGTEPGTAEKIIAADPEYFGFVAFDMSSDNYLLLSENEEGEPDA